MIFLRQFLLSSSVDTVLDFYPLQLSYNFIPEQEHKDCGGSCMDDIVRHPGDIENLQCLPSRFFRFQESCSRYQSTDIHNSSVDNQDGEKGKQSQGNIIHRKAFSLYQSPQYQSQSTKHIDSPTEELCVSHGKQQV